MMIEILKRFHMWVGLFNLTALIVFATAGIHVSLSPAPRERREPPAEVRETEYRAPQDLTDKQVADDLYARLALPMAGPVPTWALQRDAQHRLVLSFHSPNGVFRVTVLENEGKVRVEHARNSLGEFMNLMHATTLYHSPPDLRVRLWALYVDLSIFSLAFMAVTGVWLWLAARSRLWWARASFAMGTGLFALLWFVTR
jgi:hypothetical protein